MVISTKHSLSEIEDCTRCMVVSQSGLASCKCTCSSPAFSKILATMDTSIGPLAKTGSVLVPVSDFSHDDSLIRKRALKETSLD